MKTKNLFLLSTLVAGLGLTPAGRVAARLFAASLLLAIAGNASAMVHYVDVNSSNPTPPYTNWPTAATNIQDAVDAAVAGNEIVVTSGIYSPIVVGASNPTTGAQKFYRLSQ